MYRIEHRVVDFSPGAVAGSLAFHIDADSHFCPCRMIKDRNGSLVPVVVSGDRDLFRPGCLFTVDLYVGVDIGIPAVVAHNGNGESEFSFRQVRDGLFQGEFHTVLRGTPEMSVF